MSSSPTRPGDRGTGWKRSLREDPRGAGQAGRSRPSTSPGSGDRTGELSRGGSEPAVRAGRGGQGGRLDLPRRRGTLPPDLRPTTSRPRRHARPRCHRVLLVGLGRATRLMRFLTALPKTYEAEVVLGTATSTLDASGRSPEVGDGRVALAAVRSAAAVADRSDPAGPTHGVRGKGRWPPAARPGPRGDRGGPGTTPGHRLPIRRRPRGLRPVCSDIEVECSSGTYVRVLAADLGTALGGGAHLRNLRRTRIGSFTTDDATLIDELTPADGVDPGPGAARPGPGGRGRRHQGAGRPAGSPSTGCRSAITGTAPGAWSTRATGCSRSTRPPRPTGSSRRWCSSRQVDSRPGAEPRASAPVRLVTAVTFTGHGDRDRRLGQPSLQPVGSR